MEGKLLTKLNRQWVVTLIQHPLSNKCKSVLKFYLLKVRIKSLQLCKSYSTRLLINMELPPEEVRTLWLKDHRCLCVKMARWSNRSKKFLTQSQLHLPRLNCNPLFLLSLLQGLLEVCSAVQPLTKLHCPHLTMAMTRTLWSRYRQTRPSSSKTCKQFALSKLKSGFKRQVASMCRASTNLNTITRVRLSRLSLQSVRYNSTKIRCSRKFAPVRLKFWWSTRIWLLIWNASVMKWLSLKSVQCSALHWSRACWSKLSQLSIPSSFTWTTAMEASRQT